MGAESQSTMGKRDYYDVLGVPRTADPDEIKKAFRRLAKQHHPDMVTGDKKAAEEKFKEISEAYEVLADPEKRRLYDAYGVDGLKQQVWGGEDFDWSRFTRFNDVEDIFGRDLFEQFFGRPSGGQSLFENLFGGVAGRGPVRGQSLQVEVQVTLEEVARGVRKSVQIPHAVSCEACRGTGARGGDLRTCPQCNGSGQVSTSRRRGFSQFLTISACPRCGGRGRWADAPCATCRGRGTVQRTSTLDVQIPAGAPDGVRLRIPGQGEAGNPGAPPGDLFVVVRVAEHSLFRREGNDIVLDLPITMSEAALGADIEVPTLDGAARLGVPPGTQSHTILRMRGKGVPDLETRRAGDELVRVVVVTPKKLTAEEKRLLERLQELQRDAVRDRRRR